MEGFPCPRVMDEEIAPVVQGKNPFITEEYISALRAGDPIGRDTEIIAGHEKGELKMSLAVPLNPGRNASPLPVPVRLHVDMTDAPGSLAELGKKRGYETRGTEPPAHGLRLCQSLDKIYETRTPGRLDQGLVIRCPFHEKHIETHHPGPVGVKNVQEHRMVAAAKRPLSQQVEGVVPDLDYGDIPGCGRPGFDAKTPIVGLILENIKDTPVGPGEEKQNRRESKDRGDIPAGQG